MSLTATPLNRVRILRRNAGLSQRALAAKAGLPQGTVSAIETYVSDPRIGTAQKIATALGCAVDDLIVRT